MFRDSVQVRSSRNQIHETILFSFSIFFDTISADEADVVYGKFSNKLTFDLQQGRITKISTTPMRIPEMLRVYIGLHFLGESVHIVLTDEELKEKKYIILK